MTLFLGWPVLSKKASTEPTLKQPQTLNGFRSGSFCPSTSACPAVSSAQPWNWNVTTSSRSTRTPSGTCTTSEDTKKDKIHVWNIQSTVVLCKKKIVHLFTSYCCITGMVNCLNEQQQWLERGDILWTFIILGSYLFQQSLQHLTQNLLNKKSFLKTLKLKKKKFLFPSGKIFFTFILLRWNALIWVLMRLLKK